MNNLSAIEVKILQSFLSAMSMGELKGISERSTFTTIGNVTGVVNRILKVETDKSSFTNEG
jgi:hypothetical protein|tara:strand:- start:37 stop:219 length:183 start_codon:yes stop_codon:yes gene_type:complete